MRIDDKIIDIMRQEQLRGVRGTSTEPGAAQPVQPISPVPRVDRVQISDAGRRLAEHGAGAAPDGAREALAPEQTAELRHRVLSGAYDSLAVIDQVARRMLERGDI